MSQETNLLRCVSDIHRLHHWQTIVTITDRTDDRWLLKFNSFRYRARAKLLSDAQVLVCITLTPLLLQNYSIVFTLPATDSRYDHASKFINFCPVFMVENLFINVNDGFPVALCPSNAFFNCPFCSVTLSFVACASLGVFSSKYHEL